MRQWLLIAVVGLLLQASAFGDEVRLPLPPLTVWPPDAMVSLLNSGGAHPLGPANHDLMVSLPATLKFTPITLVLSAPGYKDHAMMVTPTSPDIPDPIRMVADSPWVDLKTFVRVRPGSSLSLCLLAGGLGWLGRSRYQAFRASLVRVGHLDQLKMSREEDTLVGLRVGDYRLLRKIGEGGMAIVYEAVRDADLNSRDHVAIKLIHVHADALSISPGSAEVVLTTQLRHPGIISVLDFGDHGGRPYLVMELLTGDTLKPEARRGGLHVREFVALFSDILEAVAYAHEQGVIHRDLKPGNIFVRGMGRKPVVMDFGIARATGSDTHLTKTGAILGTPVYMAPEQIDGLEADERSDQYALGVVAYELLTGRAPFSADDTLQIVMQKMVKPPPSVGSLRSDLPPVIVEVVDRMLQIQPAMRYGSLRTIMQDLATVDTSL